MYVFLYLIIGTIAISWDLDIILLLVLRQLNNSQCFLCQRNSNGNSLFTRTAEGFAHLGELAFTVWSPLLEQSTQLVKVMLTSALYNTYDFVSSFNLKHAVRFLSLAAIFLHLVSLKEFHTFFRPFRRAF